MPGGAPVPEKEGQGKVRAKATGGERGGSLGLGKPRGVSWRSGGHGRLDQGHTDPFAHSRRGWALGLHLEHPSGLSWLHCSESLRLELKGLCKMAATPGNIPENYPTGMGDPGEVCNFPKSYPPTRGSGQARVCFLAFLQVLTLGSSNSWELMQHPQ